MSESLPRAIGGYKAIALLGRSGASSVYRGFDSTGNSVAIKVFRHLGSGQETLNRLEDEARPALKLRHRNLAVLYDFGTTDQGEPFLVQELVLGASLSRLLTYRKNGLEPEAACWLLTQVGGALQWLHQNGPTPCSLRPENVSVLEDGCVKLLHFAMKRNEPPHYEAPEVIGGGPPGIRADIYSLGALAYELLTGQPPYQGDTAALLASIIKQPVPRMQRFTGRPRALDDLVEQCLQKSPLDRPASVAEFLNHLARLPSRWDPALALLVGVDLTTPLSVAAVAAASGAAASGAAASGAAASGAAAAGGGPAPAASAARRRDPQTVGRFELREKLAEGKTGDLFKAWDPMRGTNVAVKVVADGENGPNSFPGARRWLQLSKNAHRNIVQVHDMHREDGLDIVVSDFVDGQNLDDFRRHRRLDLYHVTYLVMQLGKALEFLHAEGVTHGEVKPRNILVTNKMQVSLLDSGIARPVNPEVEAYRHTRARAEELCYAPPEQLAGREDARSDIFALTAVLYELSTNERVPFPLPEGWKPANRLPKEFATLRPVIERGLAAEPGSRFPSMVEYQKSLRQAVPNSRKVTEQPRPVKHPVVALHGIRTHANWHRTFVEVARNEDLDIRSQHWYFGFFSVFRFLTPTARSARVRWFRDTYAREFPHPPAPESGQLPSIVAHSFGTYILGNALLRYPELRFDKVLLCASILPPSFPWAQLIERGQVQAVRNEHSARDWWPRIAQWFVPATGPSGTIGFDGGPDQPRIQQKTFHFEHSEYFAGHHMRDNWLPFLTRPVSENPPQEGSVGDSQGGGSWRLYVTYLLVLGLLWLIYRWLDPGASFRE